MTVTITNVQTPSGIAPAVATFDGFRQWRWGSDGYDRDPSSGEVRGVAGTNRIQLSDSDYQLIRVGNDLCLEGTSALRVGRTRERLCKR